jgi:hypothetical protein
VTGHPPRASSTDRSSSSCELPRPSSSFAQQPPPDNFFRVSSFAPSGPAHRRLIAPPHRQPTAGPLPSSKSPPINQTPETRTLTRSMDVAVTAGANPPPGAAAAPPPPCTTVVTPPPRTHPCRNPVGLRHDERRKKGTKGLVGQPSAPGVARPRPVRPVTQKDYDLNTHTSFGFNLSKLVSVKL